jgi:Na+-translocating ferredoxin:NAD+ oxidoreductase subunit C
MDGMVSSIEDEVVAIAGGAVPQEDARAETEAEATR